MAEIKLTKNELRAQQNRLKQLEKYLPTLQLKKAMLQSQVSEARQEISRLLREFERQKGAVEKFSSLLADPAMPGGYAEVEQVKKRYDNIAGVEVPYFEGVVFSPVEYHLFDTPPWTDSAIAEVRKLVSAKERVTIAEEKKRALEKEFREVSIRVNLFEKILIPRALKNIKKIKVFLGDQQLAAVSQAKAAKSKIEANKCVLM